MSWSTYYGGDGRDFAGQKIFASKTNKKGETVYQTGGDSYSDKGPWLTRDEILTRDGYYYEEVEEHLDGVIKHHKFTWYDSVDDIPMHMLTLFNRSDKRPVNKITFSKELLESRIRSLVTKRKKVLTKAEIDSSVSDVLKKANSLIKKKGMADRVLIKNTFFKKISWSDTLEVSYSRLAENLSFIYDGTEPVKIYVKPDYALKHMKKHTEKNIDKKKAREEKYKIQDHFGELYATYATILEQMNHSYFGKESFNKLSFDKFMKRDEQVVVDIVEEHKKFFKLSYSDIKELISCIEVKQYYTRKITTYSLIPKLEKQIAFLERKKDFLNEKQLNLLKHGNKIINA